MAHLYVSRNADRTSTSTAPASDSPCPEIMMVSSITSNLNPLRGGPVTRLASRRSGAPTTQLENETPEEEESTICVTRSTTRQASVSIPTTRRLRNRHKDASQVKEQDVDPVPHSKCKADSQIVKDSSYTTSTTTANLAVTEPSQLDTIIVQFITKFSDVGSETRAVMDASTPGRELLSKDSPNSDGSPQPADRGSVQSGAPLIASTPLIGIDSPSRMAIMPHHAIPTLPSMAGVTARRSLPAPNPSTLERFKPTTRPTKPEPPATSSTHAPLPTDIGRTTPGMMPLKNDANPTETTFNEPTQTVQQIPSSSAAALKSRRHVRFELTPEGDIPVALTPIIEPLKRSKRTLDMIEGTSKDKDRQTESENPLNSLSRCRKRINMGAEIQIDTTLVTPVRRQRRIVKEMLPIPLKRGNYTIEPSY